jgi:predicted lipoprotein with Yx(FWY)xxD motif
MVSSRMTVLFAGVVLAVAACGGGSKSTSGGTTTSSSTSAPAAAAKPTVAVAPNAKLGSILADSSGRTLYVFDRDTAGKIACTSGCVGVWPPLLLTAGTSTPTPGAGVTVALASVQRPDGGMQVTSGGRPLYVYSGDLAPGDANGDGFGGIWHVARPAGNPAAGAANPTATTATTAPTTTRSTGPYGY